MRYKRICEIVGSILIVAAAGAIGGAVLEFISNRSITYEGAKYGVIIGLIAWLIIGSLSD